MENTNAELVRLPLWRNCVEKMEAEGIEYGRTYPAEFFEAELRCTREDMKFGLGISQIRRQLEHKGFFLSGRGQKGSQYIILPPSANANVMGNYAAAAMDALKRGVILGTNTRLDTLSAEERRRHESMLEKMAIKAALCSKSSQVAKIIKKQNPEILELKDS